MDYKDPFHGFLTEADREYLEGTSNVEQEAERGIRSRIRKRTLNGLLDFELLFEELDESDWRLLFEELDRTELHRESTQMDDRATSVIAFLFAGIRDHADYDFEEVLTKGIRRVEIADGRKVLRAVLDIRYSETATEEAMRKLDEGKSLTDEDRQRLLDRLHFIDRLEAAREDDDLHVGPTAEVDQDRT